MACWPTLPRAACCLCDHLCFRIAYHTHQPRRTLWSERPEGPSAAATRLVAKLRRNAQHAHLQRTLSQPALQLLRSTRWPELRILLGSIRLGRPCFARLFSRRRQPRRNIRITRRWYRSEPRFFAGSLLLRNSPPAMPDNALPPRNYLHFGTRA